MKFTVIGSVQDTQGRHEVLLRAENGDEMILRTGDHIELGTELVLGKLAVTEETHASSSDAAAE